MIIINLLMYIKKEVKYKNNKIIREECDVTN